MNLFKTTCLLIFCFSVIYAQISNYRVSRVEETDPEEVTIAINPVNPDILAAGANLRYFYYSIDGGMSWTTMEMESSLGVWGDPVVQYDGMGNLFYSHLSNPGNIPGDWLDRIVVQKSVDNGLTWSDGAGVGLNHPADQDKEWLVFDQTGSIYDGYIYMGWTEFDDYGSSDPDDSSRIKFARSTDYGQSWSDAIRISDVGGDCIDEDNTVEGAVPAVGPEGQVYVCWTGPRGLVFDKSLDGGVSFGEDTYVTDHIDGWAFSVSGIFRTNGLPQTLCDISDSPYRGTIYLLWSDQRNGITDTDVFLIKSTDQGETWSDIKRVNNDISVSHQFFPWGAVDPLTGKLYIVFYDRRYGTDDATDVFVARSEDGGDTFINIKVSETSFIPSSEIFFGDYINIAAFNGKIHPIWARMDDQLLSVWTAIITDSMLTAINNRDNLISSFELKQNSPNPFNSGTTIKFSVPYKAIIQLEVYDISGRKVAGLVDCQFDEGEYTIPFDGGRLASGVYLYTLRYGAQQLTKKMVLIK